jgi:hypothetical protein
MTCSTHNGKNGLTDHLEKWHAKQHTARKGENDEELGLLFTYMCGFFWIEANAFTFFYVMYLCLKKGIHIAVGVVWEMLSRIIELLENVLRVIVCYDNSLVAFNRFSCQL